MFAFVFQSLRASYLKASCSILTWIVELNTGEHNDIILLFTTWAILNLWYKTT